MNILGRRNFLRGMGVHSLHFPGWRAWQKQGQPCFRPSVLLLLCADWRCEADLLPWREEHCSTEIYHDNYDAESTRSNIEVGIYDLR